MARHHARLWPFPVRSFASERLRPEKSHRFLLPVRSLLGLAVLLAFALAGCASGSTGGQGTGPKSGGTLNVGLDSDVVTLDPLKSTALVDREVMFNIYDTLVTVDAQNKIQPGLASSWSYPSPTQIAFTLRSGIQFQDGTPFNAAAVVTNINRILNTASSPRHSELSTVTSVKAVDDLHVQFDLKQPFSPLLANLTDRAGMILSPAVIQSQGDQIANNPAKAGTGPFQFVSWTKGDHLTLERNPHYWQKDSSGNALPYLAKVNYRPITNESVMFTNLQTETINVAQVISPTDVQATKQNQSLVYKQIPGLSFYGMELNTKTAPLDNVHVRRAVEWAVDRQEILNSVLHGIGVEAQGPVSPSSWAYDASIKPYSHNVDKAKAELSQAGMSSGVSFTLLISSGSPLLQQQAQFLQSELKPAGITVNIKQETFATLLDDTSSHHFQAALLGWSGRPDPDGNMYGWFHTGGGFNDTQYSNAHVDALLDDARTSSDQSKRTSDYQQAEKLILDDAPYVFLYHGVASQISTKNVQNFQLLPTTIMVFTKTYLS
ncbi:MAG TPA: ABC transporter substrate-binding protein [Ktedonobacterales bacterium]